MLPRAAEPAEGEWVCVATQASELAENPRSSRIDGSATTTMRHVELDHHVAEADDDQRRRARGRSGQLPKCGTPYDKPPRTALPRGSSGSARRAASVTT